MAMWKKALVLVVASLVVAFPVVTQVAMARPVVIGLFPTKQEAQQALEISPAVSQSSVVLPQGKELSDEQLRETDGEGPITALVGAAIGAATQYAIEASNGKVNSRDIVIAALSGAVTGALLGPSDAEFIARAKPVLVSAARWTARAMVAAGPAARSLGQKIVTGFNRYIGGPIVRFFHR